VAEALMVTARMIDAYRTHRQIMPLERQLMLAVYAIERSPSHSRLGYSLRSQVGAAIAFGAGETETHASKPPLRRW
jgi:hypothetical protein